MALMLLSLHALLVWGESNQTYGTLLLCHYGFFLLWQPVFRHNAKISWPITIIILVLASLSLFYMSWWVAAVWIAGLFALIGGRVFSSSPIHSRLPNIVASTYLLTILLLWVVPKLLNNTHDLEAAKFLLVYILPLLPLTILFLSVKNKPSEPVANIDFFYTLLIFLLTLITILGSFAIGTIWQLHYIKLLIFTVMGLAGVLVALSWLWNPSATFSGLELLMSRYLLSIGLPFEQWIRKIAMYAEDAPSANGFLQASMQELVSLNWVSGVMWQVEGGKQEVGEPTKYISTFSFHDLHLALYARWSFTPAMYLHVQLLTQILSEFYEAKKREETISQNAYMQSLYETGSRLTHDIKNILQSLDTLSAAAEQTHHAEDDAKLVELVKKQLPRLSQRLGSTLAKLEMPSLEKKVQAKVSTWWKNFKQLNAHYPVKFESPSQFPKSDIDPDVLDSVIDNLIQNALEKAKWEANIIVKVTLLPTEHFCVEVSDTGSAMPAEVEQRLFKSHVSSKNGLGVGLYHAAQQARQAGYELSLVKNHDGEVRFRLASLNR
ncbi:MAG: HAMP domain-containing histidine kinase [Methylotenera sp.]|nr:HAMP domain-containing histidine kinase [Methylotenera sp.]